MGKLIAFIVVSLLVATAVGCSRDKAAADLAEANEKLTAVTKERDAAQAELKKARDAAPTQLAQSESAETAAATGNDELRRQLDAARSQITEGQKTLEKAQKEEADLKGRLALAEHTSKEAEAARTNERGSADAPSVGQRTTEQVIAARDFGCEKVTFQTTLPEFKKLYPASIHGKNSRIGESSYQFNSKAVGTIEATFLDNQLLSIQLRYGEQQLEDLGGWDILFKRLQAKFGEPDITDDRVTRWTFESADRMILASGRNGGAVVVTIARTSVMADRNRRTEKLDAGF